MKVALDTNVLAYIEGVNGEARQQSAIAMLQVFAKGATLVPGAGARRALQRPCAESGLGARPGANRDIDMAGRVSSGADHRSVNHRRRRSRH
jgi:hypothetical protein